jgi:hypothetical protein
MNCKSECDNNHQAMEVLGASTLEEGGQVDESRLEEPRTEEADIKTKEWQRQHAEDEHLKKRNQRAGSNAHVASRTPRRVEEPLGCSGTNNP